MAKSERRLRIGVLGAGPIAQAAHFESCTKARNADLAAICDVAEDLRERMAITHGAGKTYGDYDRMLADPEIDAVIIATSDAFHVPAALRALEAGKHVLCEKPLGVTVEEVEALGEAVRRSGRVFQVGHMKRFDAGIEAAKAFIETEMGELVALKAWYCDSTHRYAVTDAVQPLIVASANARKPAGNPKADLRRYYMLAHGCHLIDTARHLAGDILAVRARLSERAGMWCWFVDVEFANGTLGHLDLTVAVRMDWHEGFPDLRPERQRARPHLQPLVLPQQRGRHFSRGGRRDASRARCRRAFLPPAGRGVRRRRAERRADAGGVRRRRHRIGARDGRDRAFG